MYICALYAFPVSYLFSFSLVFILNTYFTHLSPLIFSLFQCTEDKIKIISKALTLNHDAYDYPRPAIHFFENLVGFFTSGSGGEPNLLYKWDAPILRGSFLTS